MLNPLNLFKFKRPVTASECGRLGNAVKKQRGRAVIRAKCDQMRRDMGLPAVRWPE